MHKSVFRTEIIENLKVKDGGSYLDLTLGAGGHSQEILSRLSSGKLIAFDLDPAAIADFEKVEAGSNQVHLINRNFNDLTQVLEELQISEVDGVILDLGWSTDQLGRIPGLAYGVESEEPLDMRFDPSLGVTAADLVNGLYEKELLQLFEANADIVGKEARSLVGAIIEYRKHKAIQTNRDLLEVLEGLGSHLVEALRPRVFQALRIAVNNELSTLQSVLPQAWNALGSGGRLLVITFHSGEDRIVKEYFRELVSQQEAEEIFKEGFLRPGVSELSENLRARSAKLRAIQKI